MAKKINRKVTTNGLKGGNLVGNSHNKGGIPAKVVDTGQLVELEGGEVIINKKASEKHWKELSEINQSAGNGVPILPPDQINYSKGGKIMTKDNALSEAKKLGIDFTKDFHEINNSTISDGLLKIAKKKKYYKPKNASGSRARYFYYYLQRHNNKMKAGGNVSSEKYGFHTPSKTTKLFNKLKSKGHKVEDISYKNDDADSITFNEKATIWLPGNEHKHFSYIPYLSTFKDEETGSIYADEYDYDNAEMFQTEKELMDFISSKKECGGKVYDKGGKIDIDKWEKLEEELDIEFTQIDLDEIDDIYDLENRLTDEGLLDEEVIYYYRAMEILSEEDPSLNESMELAQSLGFIDTPLSSEDLASTLTGEEVIYYSNAMEILSEEDPSLRESLELADFAGASPNLNSELLASLLMSKRKREKFWENEEEINELLEQKMKAGGNVSSKNIKNDFFDIFKL